MRPKTIAIIQARMSSSRLPNKVLLDIADQPALAHVVERSRRAKTVDEVVVATTNDPSDDPVETFCKERGYYCYRGDQHDVLDRYYQAARLYGAEVIVRITGDCPLIDPDVIDKTVSAFLGFANAEFGVSDDEDELAITIRNRDTTPHASFTTPYDFAANRLPPPWGRTYPIGLDTEVCAFAGLELAWKEADRPHQREHVMPFFYEQPERFRILLVNHKIDYGSMRWTLDTFKDLEFLRQIFERFNHRNDFTWLDVLSLLEREPALSQINLRVRHKDYREIDTRQGT